MHLTQLTKDELRISGSVHVKGYNFHMLHKYVLIIEMFTFKWSIYVDGSFFNKLLKIAKN